MSKKEKLKILRRGFTLVELVVTMALTAIITGMTSAFLYFYINVNNSIDSYRKTYQNANSMAYILSTFVDQKNDGGLKVSSDSSLLTYSDSTNSYSLYYDTETDELRYGEDSLYTSSDKTLNISITYLSEYENKQLVKFIIDYDNNKKSMSFVKTLY